QPSTGPRGQDRREGDVDLGHVQPYRVWCVWGAAVAAHSAFTLAQTQDPPEVRPWLTTGPAAVAPSTRPSTTQSSPEPTLSCLVRTNSTTRAESTTATATTLMT